MANLCERTAGTPMVYLPEQQSVDLMCRVCMGSTSVAGAMVGLFDEQLHGTILADVLALVGAVEPAINEDLLPKWCCKGCRRGLESAYRLRLLCQDSDRKLRDTFSGVKFVVVKTEVNEDEPHPPGEVVAECKLEQDGMLNVEGAAVSEGLVLPKLEIMDYGEEEESQDGTDDMLEDNVSSEFNEGDEPKYKKKCIRRGKGKRVHPDVFDEVPATGFRCCGCKIRFNTLEELNAHSQEAHADKKLSKKELGRWQQCNICYSTMRSIGLRLHHHRNSLNFRCKVCGELFWSRQRVCLHHDNVHGPNARIEEGPSKSCCGCRERFETDEQLREHSNALHLPNKPPPDPDRPYVCDICYRCFATEARLYAHESRMLKTLKKHKCEECGMMFQFVASLQEHQLTHTGENTFPCPKCPQTYNHLRSLRMHLASHDTLGDKYKCELCGICFRTNSGLNKHKKQHNERPHKCPQCPESFDRPSTLTYHLRMHTDPKSLECQTCGKLFKQKSHLKQHVLFVHKKERPFACFFCPNQYKTRHLRKKHMVKFHPEELRKNPLPPNELFGNPGWLQQKSEEAKFRQQGMVE